MWFKNPINSRIYCLPIIKCKHYLISIDNNHVINHTRNRHGVFGKGEVVVKHLYLDPLLRHSPKLTHSKSNVNFFPIPTHRHKMLNNLKWESNYDQSIKNNNFLILALLKNIVSSAYTSPNSVSHYLKNVPLTIYNLSWLLKIHGHLFYGLHHNPPMLYVLQFHSCCGYQLTKVTHFILSTKIVTNEDITKLSLNNLNKYHGLPSNIVLNCESQFIFTFWKRLL
jgi:hypothetical protein